MLNRHSPLNVVARGFAAVPAAANLPGIAVVNDPDNEGMHS
jgi:hypothetical protein